MSKICRIVYAKLFIPVLHITLFILTAIYWYSVKISSVYDKRFKSYDKFSARNFQPGILVKSIHFQIAITCDWKMIFVWNFENNLKLLLSVKETNFSII